MRLACCGIGLMCILFPVATVAQARPVAGSVEGHVTCDDGGHPARLAVVRLLPIAKYDGSARESIPDAPHQTWTDLDGYYIFPTVQPGDYLIDVAQDGYSRTIDFIRKNLDGLDRTKRKDLLGTFPQVTVNAGGASRADVVIHRGGSLSGKVTFDSGGPLSQGEITATLVSSNLIQRVEGAASPGEPAQDYAVDGKTDDRGVYRIAGLPPGKYRLQLHLAEGGPAAWGVNKPTRTGTAELTIFAPEALRDKDAQIVEVKDGDDITGLDISIPLRLLHSVGGVVTWRGTIVDNALVKIWPSTEAAPKYWTWSAPTIVDGTYRIDLVPAGSYVLEAHLPEGPGAKDGPRRILVTVGDSDVFDANIDLGP